MSVKRTNVSHSRQLFNTLIPRSRAYRYLIPNQHSVHCAGLVTLECTCGVIDPLYHSRQNDRDRQYECDRGIRRFTVDDLQCLYISIIAQIQETLSCSYSSIVKILLTSFSTLGLIQKLKTPKKTLHTKTQNSIIVISVNSTIFRAPGQQLVRGDK